MSSVPLHSNPSKRYRLQLLGTFRLEASDAADDWRVVNLPRRKVEALLAYLVLHPEAHSRERLAALLWGDSPDARARASLRTGLATLRRFLGDGLLCAERDSVGIDPAFPLDLDAVAFARLIAASTADSLQAAVALYHGELLAGFYDDWALALRDRYHALYIDGLLQLTQQMRAQSEYGRAIEFARQALAAEPALERAHQHLMFCYMASGDRQAALDQYEQCAAALRAELAVAPAPDTQALRDWIRQTPAAAPSPAARITNLPIPVTSFVGRRRETAELKRLLTDAGREPGAPCRLLTLVGAGGSGKTRLAMQIGADLIDHFRDGVWWIPLDALRDAQVVPHAVAKTLGIGESPNQSIAATLATALQGRQLLLVLDNCEHLIEVCAELADTLLRGCPQVTLLATSREPLNIAGECVWHVPTLPVPARRGALSLADLLMSFESIRLFVERARAVQRDFEVTEQNAPAIVQICQRLDGIPLAIELAAVRTRALSVPEIAARLDDRFELLTSGGRTSLPRQQTLRALIDWSHDLLDSGERQLFRRLSVFTGGWSLEMSEAVCADDPGASTLGSARVLDLLARLVDKSLVVAEAERGDTRYRLLDTMGAYAREKLEQSGEAAAVHDRHLAHMISFAAQAEPELQGPRQAAWLDRLETEHNNLRAALAWSLRTEANAAQVYDGLRLAGSLYWYWVVRGPLSEGRQWLETALARNPVATGPDEARAKALAGLGEVTWNQNDLAVARACFTTSLETWQALGNDWWIGFSTLCIAWVQLYEGDLDGALATFEESIRLARAVGDKSLLARALRGMGNAHMRRDPRRAEPYFSESADLLRAVGDNLRLAYALSALGAAKLSQADYAQAAALCAEAVELLRAAVDRISLGGPLHIWAQAAVAMGRIDEAAALYAEGLALAQQVDDLVLVGLNWMGLGGVAAARAEYSRAAELLSAGRQLLADAEVPNSVWQRYHNTFEEDRELVRRQLGPANFEQAWETGRRHTREQAMKRALT